MAKRKEKLPHGVRRLKSGRLQARHTGPDGVRRSAPVTFTTITDAKAWLDEQQRASRVGVWRDPRAGQVSFGAYADTWLQTRQLTPRTRAEYRKLVSGHLGPAFGAMPLRLITPVMVRDWYAGLDTGPTRKAHAYGLLRAILNTAVADDAIAANPCRVRGAGTSKRGRDPHPASIAELDVIVAEMPERYRAAVLLAAWCALRFGELTELRRSDIDTRRGVIHVRRGVVLVDGEFVVRDPKSDAGKRDVTIPPHLLPMVREHLLKHAAPGRDGLLFPAKDGGHLATSSLYGRKPTKRSPGWGFYRARHVAGRDDLRWHDLRHTGAVLAAQTGATLAELMGRLGHSTPGAALRYQHAAEGRDAEIARKLSEMAKGEV